MKHFAYYRTKDFPKRGTNLTIFVFQIIKNVPRQIGYVDVSTTSYAGDIETAYRFLLTKGKVETIGDRNQRYRENRSFIIHPL